MLNIITRYIKRSRKTPSLPLPLKTLLLSLAVSDLGVGFLVQPTYVAVLVMKIEHNADNSAYYTIFDAFYVQSCLLSFASFFFSVLALTVDRLLAFYLHLRYQELVTPGAPGLVTYKSVVVVVSSVWVLSAFIALLGLKWKRSLGFISIQLPSEEDMWNTENFLGLFNYSRNESFPVSVSLERENSCRAIQAIQKFRTETET